MSILHNDFFEINEVRIGLVSHPKFFGNKPPFWMDNYIKTLQIIFEEFHNTKIKVCCGKNPIGMDYYLQHKWRRIGIEKPIPFGWDMKIIPNNTQMSIQQKYKQMFLNLVNGVDFLIYFTHPNPNINTYGYIIDRECDKIGIPYIESLIMDYDMDEMMNEVCRVVRKVESFGIQKNS